MSSQEPRCFPHILRSVEKGFLTWTDHLVLAMAAAGLLGVGVALATSESAAEPILGEESLSLPPPTAQKQATTDALSLFKARDFEGALKLWKEAAQKDADLPPLRSSWPTYSSRPTCPRRRESAWSRRPSMTPPIQRRIC